MKIAVPFVYLATLVPVRCRKSVDVFVADTIELEIADISDAKLAGRMTSTELIGPDVVTEYYFWNDALWSEYSVNAGQSSKKTYSLQDWVELLQRPTAHGNPAGGHFLAAMRDAQSKYSSLPTPETLSEAHPYREYVEDQRAEEVDSIRKSLARFGVYGDKVFIQKSEPVYYCQTFGMGNNHGGTSLFAGSITTALSCTNRKGIFNVNDKVKALEYTERRALERSDTKSVPVRCRSDFEVFMPEAFTFEPYPKEALDAGEITLSEYLQNHSADVSKLNRLIDDAARAIAEQMKAASGSEQIEWLAEQGVDEDSIIGCYNV